MTDISQFAVHDFDPRQWINAACASAPDDDSLERHLAGLEMRLSLAGEDLELTLASASDRALRCIPAAAAEATALQEDVAALQGTLQRQVIQMEELRAASARSTGVLAILDGVKSRMEAACTTLKEATELSELFKRVEAVFGGGDVTEIAALLGRMRASLALVGHVPEFAGGLQRLSALEDRFQGLIEGSLAAAFAERRGTDVAQLGTMMQSVGRGSAVQRLYISARLPPIQAQWDAYDPSGPGGLPAWLPAFYGAVESMVDGEARWLQPVLPAQASDLTAALVVAVFTKIDKSFRMRLSNALTSARSQVEGPLQVLAQLHAVVVSTVRSIAAALWELQQQQLRALASAAYQPFESQILRYGELEGRQLAAELAAIRLPDTQRERQTDSALLGDRGASRPSPVGGSDGFDVEGAVEALAASCAPAMTTAQEALDRAWKITGGTGLQQLFEASDAALAAHGSRQLACIDAVQSAVFAAVEQQAGRQMPVGSSSDSPQGTGAGEASLPHLSDEATAVLPLLAIGGTIASQVNLLDSRLRAAAVALQPTLEQAAAAQDADQSGVTLVDATDPVMLRLLAAEGALLHKLQTFVRSTRDAWYTALPSATAAAASLQTASEQLVYDVLMIRVLEQLKDLSSLDIWASAAPNDFGLPTFSTYPGSAVAGAGEYLLMLPQLLEAALEGGPTLEGMSAPESATQGSTSAAVDGDWLDKVAAAAAAQFTSQLSAIPRLSPAGAAQAAADTEYLANVLSALGVPLPQQLVTWQLLVGLPPGEFSAADVSALHMSTVKHIAQIRNLPSPGNTGPESK